MNDIDPKKCYYCGYPTTKQECKCRTIPIRILEEIWSKMFTGKYDKGDLAGITDQIKHVKDILIKEAHK